MVCVVAEDHEAAVDDHVEGLRVGCSGPDAPLETNHSTALEHNTVILPLQGGHLRNEPATARLKRLLRNLGSPARPDEKDAWELLHSDLGEAIVDCVMQCGESMRPGATAMREQRLVSGGYPYHAAAVPATTARCHEHRACCNPSAERVQPSRLRARVP